MKELNSEKEGKRRRNTGPQRGAALMLREKYAKLSKTNMVTVRTEGGEGPKANSLLNLALGGGKVPNWGKVEKSD